KRARPSIKRKMDAAVPDETRARRPASEKRACGPPCGTGTRTAPTRRRACATSLDPALLAIVALRTLVQRRRKAVLDHVLRLQVGQCGMQPLELVEVVEHRLDNGVDRVGGGLR